MWGGLGALIGSAVNRFFVKYHQGERWKASKDYDVPCGDQHDGGYFISLATYTVANCASSKQPFLGKSLGKLYSDFLTNSI